MDRQRLKSLERWKFRGRAGMARHSGATAMKRLYARITRRRQNALILKDDSMIVAQPKKIKDFWWNWF